MQELQRVNQERERAYNSIESFTALHAQFDRKRIKAQ